VISICDTGPLVAYLNRRDPHHRWAVALMRHVSAPMLTSEPVLTVDRRDFSVYRRNDRQVIDFVAPPRS